MSQKNNFGLLIGDAQPNWETASLPLTGTLLGKWCVVEVLNIEKHAGPLFNIL